MHVCYCFIQRYAKEHETVNTASANVTSLLITLPAPDDPSNSNKSLFNMYISICTQEIK